MEFLEVKCAEVNVIDTVGGHVKIGPAIRCKEIRPEHVDWCQ